MLRPAEAARLLNVNPRTLASWADNGLIPVIVLPTGIRRFRRADIDAILKPKKAAS